MKLVNNIRWAVIASGILSGPALAAEITCTVTPANSIITSGETLQLAATCEGGPLASITWKQGGAAIADATAVPLSGDTSKPIYFTAPAGAPGDYVFTVTGVAKKGTDNVVNPSSEARVLVNGAAVNFGTATMSALAASDPADGQCGSVSGTTVTTFPANGALCAKGKSSLVITAPNHMTWSCLGLSGGLEASCYVNKGVTYTVSVTNLNASGGSYTVNPTGPVGSGESVTVTAQPNGSNVATMSGCSGAQSGNTFNIASVTQNCTVQVNFGAQPVAVNGACGSANGGTFSSAPTSNLCSAGTPSNVATGSSYTWSCAGSNNGATASCSATKTVTAPPPVGDDPGIGGGLWVPPNMPNRTVADQSRADMDRSYVPGCLNGQFSSNSSAGCAGSSVYTGKINGVDHTVSFGGGKQVVLRYKTPATITDNKIIKVTAWNGQNVAANMRVWLSTSPTATYDSVSAACKQTSAGLPSITTGSVTNGFISTVFFGSVINTPVTYCKLDPNTVYYFGIEYDDTSLSAHRYQVLEAQADFL